MVGRWFISFKKMAPFQWTFVHVFFRGVGQLSNRFRNVTLRILMFCLRWSLLISCIAAFRNANTYIIHIHEMHAFLKCSYFRKLGNVGRVYITHIWVIEWLYIPTFSLWFKESLGTHAKTTTFSTVIIRLTEVLNRDTWGKWLYGIWEDTTLGFSRGGWVRGILVTSPVPGGQMEA